MAAFGTGLFRWLSLAAVVALCATMTGPVRTAGATPGPCGDPATRPWCDTALSADQRASLLLAALTQDEKLSLLAGVGGSGHTGQTRAIPRVGLRAANLTDDGVGLKQGTATAVPIPMALAATFDPNMAGLHGGLIANEARARGNDIILGPTVNLVRTPLGGRTFEAYGEDPYLISRTAVNWIEAAQAQGVIAEVKHFCCNNQEGKLGVLGQKNYVSADVDERTLREIYLPQFEAAVKEAHAGTVMCAYNRVNEDWACEHQHLLSDILKGEWAFQGAVVSDWQATHFTIPALRNGLDLEMPTPMDYSPGKVKLALATTLVTQAQVDDHVRRLLRTLFSFGFMDRAAYPDNATIDFDGHAQVAQRIEESGITLLQNSGLLPLRTAGLKSIALVGPQANRFENGGNTDNVVPSQVTTPRQAITQRAGPGVNVVYNDGSNAAQAASVAAAADVAVVFASDSEGEYKEKNCASVDCTTAGKTGHQDELIAAVAASNPNTIVVLETGGPVLTPWRDSVRAVMEAWYPGEEGGAAISRVLFGDVDPGGRLPATFPRQQADMPTSGDPTKYPGGTDVFYKEGVFAGYRWYDANNLTPAFAFGSGLSYTTFRFDQLGIQAGGPGAGTVATVTARVTNTGSRSGVAVPELYLGLPSPSATVRQPPRQLKGYNKLALAAGQSQVVSFALNDRAFSYWDVGSNDWRVAPGCYGVFVGSSSRELPLQGSIGRGVTTCPLAGRSAPVPLPGSTGGGLPNTGAGDATAYWWTLVAALAAAAARLGLRRRMRRRALALAPWPRSSGDRAAVS